MDKTRQRQKMIVRFDWDDLSGVDHPANEEEGWMILKQKFEGNLDELVAQEEERIQKDLQLLRYLDSLDFTDAPEDVQKALQTVVTWLEEQYNDLETATSNDQTDEVKKHELPFGAVAKLVARVFKTIFIGAEVAKEVAEVANTPSDEEKVVKALQQAWPHFLTDVAAIFTGNPDITIRKTAAQDAIERLQAAVISALSEEEHISE